MLGGYTWLDDGSLCRTDLLNARYARMSAQLKKDETRDSRTPTERDVGRILYSSKTRRLAGVAQIVSPTLLNTSIHTRLTHSLRVSQLSREIATDILRGARKSEVRGDSVILERIANAGGLDIAACAAAGLAHDIGHTPYGHVAARLLDEWVSAQDADGFEGNAQTIRAVGALDNKPGTEYGLDLTAVTLCALMKYPYTRKLGEPKFSIYDSEKDILAFARKALPDVDSFGALSNSERQSLEASVMNLADDITYATHDLEDFIVANMLKITTVLETLEAARDTLTQFEPEDIDTNHPNPLVRDALRHAARDADELSLDEYRLALRDAIQYFKRLAGPGGASADGATDGGRAPPRLPPDRSGARHRLRRVGRRVRHPRRSRQRQGGRRGPARRGHPG